VAHGAALDRVRVLDEAHTASQSRVDELEAELATSARDRQAMRRQLDGQRDEIEALEATNAELRTATDALQREHGTTSKQATNDRIRDLERLLDIAEAEHDSLMQEVCDLRNAPAPVTSGPSADDDGKLAELEAQLGDLRASCDSSAAQVKELENEVASSLLHRDEALEMVSQLERALSQEQSHVRDVEEELRRLQSSTHVDARAVATGRAEPAAVEPAPVLPEDGAAPAAEAHAPDPDPAAEADLGPDGAPHVERRSAFAELSGIASLGEDGFRRR
jgi:chromosome segregation ATPase